MNRILDNKVVIVTGATGGIGQAACRILGLAGATLVLSDRAGDTGDALADDIRRGGSTASFIAADLTSESEIAALVEATLSLHGRVDCAFNTAGVESNQKPLAELTLEEWQRVIDLDLTATFLCMKYQILAMLREGRGAIVNTAAGIGQIAFPKMADYVAAKAGLIGLTRAAAVDYGKHHIRVNAILPGAIKTPMLERAQEIPAFAENFGRILDRHALGRIGQPEEVGHAAAWLLSDQASFVTGVAMPVDGGFLVT